MAVDDDVRQQFGPGTDRHVLADDAEGTDLGSIADDGSRMDHGGEVKRAALHSCKTVGSSVRPVTVTRENISSAEQTSFPSTCAVPLTQPMRERRRSIVTSMSSRSPGITWRRKRAFSMPVKSGVS